MNRMNHLALLALVGAIVSEATAQTSYTFTGNVSSKWNVSGNWSPNNGNIPGASDDATIGSGKLCTIEDRGESIATLTVTGTLKLIDRNLTVYTSATVNGAAMQFKHNAGTAPVLYIANVDTRFYGSGTLDATLTNLFGPATIRSQTAGMTNNLLSFYDTLAVKGSVTFDGVDIYLNTNAKLVVDSADVMDIGYPNVCDLLGDGTLQVSSGEAILDYVTGTQSTEWKLNLSGGEIEVGAASSLAPLAKTQMSLYITGGTFDVDNDINGGIFEFSGGTINVLAGSVLFFDQD